MGQRGRVKKIQAEQHVVLREIVAEKPLATLEEVGAEFTRRTGIRVHSATLTKGLREAGIERRRGPGNDIAEVPVSKAKRYGYTQAHRAKAPEQRYRSCLSDAEWSRVEDIFSNDGGRGLPPRYPRRLLLDACCYVVRTGCSWRMLPKDFPQWQNV